MIIRSFFRKLCRDEKGSLTLEASLILPIAFLVAVFAVFIMVFSLQANMTYVTAEETSDRIAHTWDNSHKHPVTGMYSLLEQDSLYWRWLYDGAEQWFGLASGNYGKEVIVPASPGETDDLIERKLLGATTLWPEGYSGSGVFTNRGFTKSVTTTAGVAFQSPSFLSLRLPGKVEGSSGETIIEPSEFIRNVELLLAYIPAIVQELGGDGVQNVLSPWLNRTGHTIGDDVSLTFRTHAEAVSYTRTLVNGREKRIPTKEIGHWRLIDAMDKHGIAHQTYIGVKTANKEITDQLLKDAELLRRGEVNGVVWHFFKRTGEADSGPAPELQRLLQKHGIMIVIHS